MHIYICARVLCLPEPLPSHSLYLHRINSTSTTSKHLLDFTYWAVPLNTTCWILANGILNSTPSLASWSLLQHLGTMSLPLQQDYCPIRVYTVSPLPIYI